MGPGIAHVAKAWGGRLWCRGMVRHSVGVIKGEDQAFGGQASDPLLDTVRGEVKQVLG